MARPQGCPTRGKTAPNRLRRLDIFVCATQGALLQGQVSPFFVDLGYGRVPRTTLESADRFRRLAPRLEVLGIELDAERVEAAQAHVGPETRFERGGFEHDPGRPVHLLRAMNVLRQYPPEDVDGARARLGRHLAPGGLLLEGTSDPFGRLITCHLFRRHARALHHEGLLFSAARRPDFHPTDLQTVLPKDLITEVRPGTPVHAFFLAWSTAWAAASPWRPYGPRAVFREAAARLQEHMALERQQWLARHGYVWWRPSTPPIPLPRLPGDPA